jgi:cyclic beta-1,2-glucan synthetase
VRWSTCRLVKSWMAHHHGMSMLSMANFLCDNIAQRWFHANRRVQATELLLHEKPIAHVPKSRFPRANAA